MTASLKEFMAMPDFLYASRPAEGTAYDCSDAGGRFRFGLSFAERSDPDVALRVQRVVTDSPPGQKPEKFTATLLECVDLATSRFAVERAGKVVTLSFAEYAADGTPAAEWSGDYLLAEAAPVGADRDELRRLAAWELAFERAS